jgi:predicted lysophospholipase L1 biosynthesis ABC-type transport system permease subunit
VSRTVRWIALLLSLGTIAIVVGFAAAIVVLLLLQAILPPFQPSDDDTLREFVPAVLAYAAWGAGGLATAILGWRRIRRYR